MNLSYADTAAKWRTKCFAWYGKKTSEAIIRLLDELEAAIATEPTQSEKDRRAAFIAELYENASADPTQEQVETVAETIEEAIENNDPLEQSRISQAQLRAAATAVLKCTCPFASDASSCPIHTTQATRI